MCRVAVNGDIDPFPLLDGITHTHIFLVDTAMAQCCVI